MPDPEPAIPEPTRHPTPGPVARALNLPFLGAIWAYRCTLSPFIGGACRFDPTCSRYALEAYRVHGPWLGTRLTVRRVLRCHPWGGGGYDPVPHNEPPGCEDRTPVLLLHSIRLGCRRGPRRTEIAVRGKPPRPGDSG